MMNKPASPNALKPALSHGCRLSRWLLLICCVGYFTSVLLAHPAQADPLQLSLNQPAYTGAANTGIITTKARIDPAKTTSALARKHTATTHPHTAIIRLPQWLWRQSRPSWQVAVEIFKAVAYNPWDHLDESHQSRNPLGPDQSDLGQWQWQLTQWDTHLQFSDDYLSLQFQRRF